MDEYNDWNDCDYQGGWDDCDCQGDLDDQGDWDVWDGQITGTTSMTGITNTAVKRTAHEHKI